MKESIKTLMGIKHDGLIIEFNYDCFKIYSPIISNLYYHLYDEKYQGIFDMDEINHFNVLLKPFLNEWATYIKNHKQDISDFFVEGQYISQLILNDLTNKNLTIFSDIIIFNNNVYEVVMNDDNTFHLLINNIKYNGTLESMSYELMKIEKVATFYRRKLKILKQSFKINQTNE